MYDNWCRFSAENGMLWLLEKSGSVRLLKTQKQYGDGMPAYMYSEPVYHVWSGERWIAATGSYREALTIYNNERIDHV